MNQDTAVAVFGYAGDAHQVRMMFPYYAHHQCPVVIMSPTDSPILPKDLPQRANLYYNRPGVPSVVHPEPVIFKQAGLRAYTGQVSLDRQAAQLRLLLDTVPHSWFLLNDSDSVVLSPELPSYIYSDIYKVWSNIVDDSGVHPLSARVPGYSYPQLAFQPPYFVHRKAIERLLAVAPGVPADPRSPFIDWCMMAWTVKAGLSYGGFPDGCSAPTNDANQPSINAVSNAVQNEGKIFIHSVKTMHVLQRLAYDRLRFKRTHGLK